MTFFNGILFYLDILVLVYIVTPPHTHNHIHTYISTQSPFLLLAHMGLLTVENPGTVWVCEYQAIAVSGPLFQRHRWLWIPMHKFRRQNLRQVFPVFSICILQHTFLAFDPEYRVLISRIYPLQVISCTEVSLLM